MSALRLAVLLVFGASCCVEARVTQNPDTPEYARLASIVVEQLKEHMEARLAPLEASLSPLKAAIEDVQATVEEACGGGFAVDIPAVPPPPLLSSGLAEVTSKLQAMEGELSDMKYKIDALDGRTENLATTSGLKELKHTIGKQLTTTVAYVERVADDMVTRTGMVVRKHVGGVKEAVKEVQEACGNDDKMGLLWNMKDIMEEVRGVGEKEEEVASKVEGLQGVLEMELLGISDKVDEITNTTQLLANATLQDEDTEEVPQEQVQEEGEDEQQVTVYAEEVGSGETGTVYPCLDSTFQGSRANSICRDVVRQRKCHLPPASYHCCHTCTSLGLLPVMGPWRYQNLSRKVYTN